MLKVVSSEISIVETSNIFSCYTACLVLSPCDHCCHCLENLLKIAQQIKRQFRGNRVLLIALCVYFSRETWVQCDMIHYQLYQHNISTNTKVKHNLLYSTSQKLCSLLRLVVFFFFYNMMTSSNGNIFRVTGPLCGEIAGHRWIPRTKASDAELWCFLWSAPEWTLE